MIKKAFFLNLFLFLVVVNKANCWFNEGHMIVANIAKNDLINWNPEAYYFFNNITQILNSERHGKIKNLVESSTWPDLVKSYQLGLMDAWHFRDIPVNYSNPNIPEIDESIENNALFFIVNF